MKQFYRYLTVIMTLCSLCLCTGNLVNGQATITSVSQSVAWDQIGPSWTQIGPGGGGAFCAIAIDPKNDDIVYVGTDLGGLYKTEDGGKSFRAINKGLKELVIQEIAIDPNNSDIIYAGTTGGLYKSLDGGNSWIKKKNGFIPSGGNYQFPVKAIAIDPRDSRIVYAAVSETHGNAFFYKDRADRFNKGQIYKSLDGGETWEPINRPGNNDIDPNATIFEIAVSPKDSNIVYATTNKGFYKSIDGGRHWQAKNTGLQYYDTRGLSVDPVHPDTIYITVWSPQSPWDGGVFKSINGGESWTRKNLGLLHRNDGSGKRTSNYPEVVVSKSNPSVVYTGDWAYGAYGPQKSANGGDSWTGLIVYKTTGERNIDIGPHGNFSVSCLDVSAIDHNVVYFGTSMGLFKTEDGGKSWVTLHTQRVDDRTWQGKGIENTCVFDIEISPSDPNTIYVGYADISLWKSTDGGISFKIIKPDLTVTGYDYISASKIKVDPDDQNIVYVGLFTNVSSTGVLLRSIDGGMSWEMFGSEENGLLPGKINAILVDTSTPMRSRTIYVASYGNGIYKREASRDYWQPLNTGLPERCFVQALTMDPSDPKILYAGMGSASIDKNGLPGGVFKSIDGGKSWVRIDDGVFGDVYDIKVISGNSKAILVGTRVFSKGRTYLGGLFRNTDGSNEWTRVISDKWIKTIAVDPKKPNLIYAGGMDNPYYDGYTDPERTGIYKSVDGGKNWSLINNNLFNVNIYDIEIVSADQNTIYVGTSGAGLFKAIDSNLVKFQLGLKPGWNLISLPLEPINTKIEEVLKSIDGSYESVWTYDGGWQYYFRNAAIKNSLDEIRMGKGYFIRVMQETVLSIVGQVKSNIHVPLKKGWNLVGYNIIEPVKVIEMLSATGGNCDSILQYDPMNGYSELLHDYRQNGDSLLFPGKGYWVKVTNDCLLVLK